jgi:hypothetical protein
MYRAACGQMKALLSAKAEDIRARLLRTVAAEAMERNQATKARFDAIIEKLQEEPQVRPRPRALALALALARRLRAAARFPPRHLTRRGISSQFRPRCGVSASSRDPARHRPRHAAG